MTQNGISKNINGPVNVFRMEGKINGIKKIIYLFADIHMPVNDQTQCDDINAIEIREYLLNNFKKLEKKENVDFFFEVSPTYKTTLKLLERGFYIKSLASFFMKCFNYDITKNKIYTSTILPNVRFHYMDIRKLISFDFENENITIFNNYLIDFYIEKKFNISINIADLFIITLKKFEMNYKFIHNSLFEDKKNHKKEQNKNIFDENYKFDENTAKNIIKKTYDVTNENIKKIFETIKKKYIEPKILKCITLTKKIIILFEKYKQFQNEYMESIDYLNRFNKLKIKIHYKLYHLYLLASLFGVILTDMFFLRRVLDKSYISNGIIYSGAAHTTNYIFLLIKYFDFKITHFSYLNDNIDNITNIIKNTSDNYDIYDLYNLLFTDKFIHPIYQCSNIANFPEKFS